MAEERAFSWDEEIEAVENEFVDIPAGDYDFKITNFERGYFEGSEKMPACNEAKITYEENVNGQEGRIKQNLFLHSKSQWQLTGFARAIGHMKKGDDKFTIRWNEVLGATGRFKIKLREYNGKTYPNVDRFYDKEESGKEWTQGAF